jgi:hypothetical protein
VCCLSLLSILEASFLRLCLRTCDLKCVYRNSGEGSRKASGYRSEWLLSNGDSQPVRSEDDRPSGSDDLQVTKRRVCSRRGKSSEETRRRASLFQLWVRVERRGMLQTLSSLPCNSQPPALHLLRSSAYQAFQSIPMAMRKKGKKVHARYESFLLSCDFSSL